MKKSRVKERKLDQKIRSKKIRKENPPWNKLTTQNLTIYLTTTIYREKNLQWEE